MSYQTHKHRDRDDFYPSRSYLSGQILERIDPVIYPSSFPNPLSSEMTRRYEEDGFLILDDVFDAQEVQRFQQEVDCLRTKQSDEVIYEANNGDVRSVFRVHEQSPVFRRLAADSRLAELARFILGDQVYLHQSRVNYKPGFRGQEFHWHSDFETWHVEDGMPAMRALSISIALTDNDQTNGPLLLIPGSHKKYVVCEGETPEEHYRSSLRKQGFGVPGDEYVQQLVDEGGIVAATGRPGSVILFDCNVLHGSNSNITPFPRSNVFFVYNALSNRVDDPFCGQPPRPEYICSRKNIEPLTSKAPERLDGY